jgi:hypothetical protein
MTAQKAKWKPSSYRPVMLGNGPSLGFAPLTAVLPWVLRIGLPFIGGASVAALFSSAAKEEDDGSGGTFNWENIGLSTLLGGAGAAGFYVSGVLPEGIRPIGYAASVVSVAASIYFMFQPKKKSSEPGQKGGPLPGTQIKDPVPPMAPGPLARSLLLSPDLDYGGFLSGGGAARSIYFVQPYWLHVQNGLPETANFCVGLRIDLADSTSPIFRSRSVTDLKFGRKCIAVLPGEERVIQLDVPAMFGKSSPFAFWASGVPTGPMALSFELFEQPDSALPFMTSEAVPIVYWWTG